MSYGGSEGGKKAGAAYEDKRDSTRLMRAQGVTRKAIAIELGVAGRSVRNWLKKSEK